MAEYEVSRFDYKDNTYKFKDASARADIEELQQQAEVDAKAVGDVSQTTTSTTIGPAPIVTFDASAANMPLKELTVDIEPVQAAGTPSHENPLPITGWTGCNVTRAGENLCEDATISPDKSFSDDNGTIVNSNVSDIAQNIDILGGETYFFTFEYAQLKNTSNRRYMWYDNQGNPIVGRYAYDPATKQAIMAAPSNAAKLSITVDKGCTDFQLYLQRNVLLIPITFPASAGTVYGGMLDVVNEKLTVTKGLMTINENSSISVDSSGFYVRNDDVMRLSDYSNAISSNRLKTVSDHITLKNEEGISAYSHATALLGKNWIYFKLGNPEITTVEGVKAWLTDNPIKVLYPLATPIVYDLSDVPEILTLYGTNNIWADCGDVTVTYGAYLETVKAHAGNEDKTTRAMLAPVEEGSTASANYAIGDMLVFSGKLCKATATIASGDTLAIGTNLTSTTVENELKANYVLPASGIPKADLAADVQKSLDTANASMFLVNGTNTSQLFKFWWSLSDPEEGRYARLEKFFALLADSWADKKYTLKWYKASISSSSVMTPLDDLEGKSAAQLCTDATSPVEDWADEDPMTWYVRANALSLADGTMNILAIEGLDDDFDLTGETAPVWTFSMALWKKEWELGDYKYKSWATTQLDEYYKPYAGDVDPNTNKKRIMTWRPTFPGSLTADGSKLTSGVGGKPYLFVGAATAITKARAMDAYEGLWNDADAIWVLDMWQLRHFNLENSGICEGCQSYDYSPTIAVAETGVTRVLLTTANAANYQVGSNVSIGTNRANNIRTILSKEDVEVGGTTYTALNLDGEAFDTKTSQKVFTMPWNSGNTENLPAHKDGACHSLTAGQNPLRVQGVEMMSGAYDIGLDPLYNVTNFANSKGDYAVFECRDSEKLAGSITADYEDTGISYAQMPKSWNYPKTFVETDKAVLFPAELGGSTSAYYKSGFVGTDSAGVRCPWRCGHLDHGAYAGVACEAGFAPSGAYWSGRPRLSGSGKKRGVWTA